MKNFKLSNISFRLITFLPGFIHLNKAKAAIEFYLKLKQFLFILYDTITILLTIIILFWTRTKINTLEECSSNH
jgi:hypothetical protein